MSAEGTSPPPRDRRKSPRIPASQLPSVRASILAGPDVQIVNVSREGLLVESDVRLTPGIGVCLNLVIEDQAHPVSGRIVRVDASLVGGRMKYRAGVALDEEIVILDVPSSDSTPASPSQAALPAPHPAANDVVQPIVEFDSAEIASLRQQLADHRREQQQQSETLETLRKVVESGEALRRQLLDEHTADRERWQEEQRLLEARVQEAETATAEISRDLRAARDRERRLVLEHEQQRAQLEGQLRERQQQIAELEASHAALLADVSQRLQANERDRSTWASEQTHMTSRLESTENWCADQQNLLYHIRQQVNAVMSLIEGNKTFLGPPTIEAAPNEQLDRAQDATVGLLGDGTANSPAVERKAASDTLTRV
jgi:hypothetical protein